MHQFVQEQPERWARALERAISAGLDVLVCAATGEAFVESASRPGELYAVSADSCTCQAGQQSIPCKHVACYRAQVGLLSLPQHESSAPVECLWCRGCGKVENTVELRYDICRECGGS